MLKILFIEPPVDSNFIKSRVGTYSEIAPLWPLALATYSRERMPGIKIKIIDGRISPHESLDKIKKEIKRFKPDFVGLSPMFTNYYNTIDLARAGKKSGARIILGGAHAAHLKTEILKNRGLNSKDYCVDAIVQFDGEQALYEYVAGKPLSKIKNLVYLENDKVVVNPIELLDLDSLPISDRGLLNLERDYFKRKRFLIFYSQKGCAWREKSGGCLFCAQSDIGLRLRNPQMVWEEIIHLNKRYQPTLIWDNTRDIFNDLNWFEEFHRISFKYPKKPRLRVSLRTDGINKKTVKMLKDMNVAVGLLGLESGSSKALSMFRKGVTLSDNGRAVKLLHSFGIGTFHSFVLGAPEESKETISDTINFARELVREGGRYVVETMFSVLMPFPGTPAWKMLLEKTGDKYEGRDLINWHLVARDWIKNFCHISLGDFAKMLKKARQIT